MLNHNRPFHVCVSSGLKAVDDSPVIIKGAAGRLRGILVYTDGINDATVTLYDHASAASGNILTKAVVIGADKYGGNMNLNVEALNGIVMELSGNGCSAIVYYT